MHPTTMATSSITQETQPESAQRMYNARAANYESSWHPTYSRRFTSHAPLRPGADVLALCCGTGLDAFLAAEQGCHVVGVDITAGMLAQLKARRDATTDREVAGRIRVVRGDVTDLDGGLLEVEDEGETVVVGKGEFDVILCSCAFVLLQDPSRVVAHWKEFLKPGGAMVIDITHKHNLRAGTVLETVARVDLGWDAFPSNRLWIKSQESFKEILEAQGMRVEKAVVMEELTGHGNRWIGVEEADAVFDGIVSTPLTERIAAEEFKREAKPLFRKRWEEAAADGKVEDVDALYLYVARKPE